VHSVDTDLARFAAALKESAAADKAAAAAQRRATAHREALEQAQLDLRRAIDAVRAAKVSGHGGAEADLAWRAAKARVIELETGHPPAWATITADRSTVEESLVSESDSGDAGDTLAGEVIAE
jgi:hypothetical protein